MISLMDNSGLVYQVLGDEVQLLLVDRQGEVMEEDIVGYADGTRTRNPLSTYTIGHLQPP